jgi:hypothetical protein
MEIPTVTGEVFGLPMRATWDSVRYHLMVLWNWTHSAVHNAYDTCKVVDYMLLRRMDAGLVDRNHPWVTGLSPHTGKIIWPDNIVFASPRKSSWSGPVPEADEIIVTRIGNFLAAMVAKSTQTSPAIPRGPKRRMPHAVNYLHGPVHFNGGYIIFDDFEDAIFRMTDPAFVQEMKRFAAAERRELTIVFRERRYDPEEYAWCVGFVRAHLPWYANGNGPTPKRVLWGTPSPYAAINPINGSWRRDMEDLRAGNLENLARPPIPKSRYFRGHYRGTRRHSTWIERFHAWVIYRQISMAGFQGGMVFTRRKLIEPDKYEEYRRVGRKHWRSISEVSNPFFKRRRPS